MASNTYTIKNAKLLFRNFAGVQDRFGNSARTFCVIIPDDAVEDFQREGFNIKTLKPRDETEEPLPFIKVKVNFGGRPPKLVSILGKTRTLLNEQTVGALDFADLDRADIAIRPYHGRTRAGVEFCSAYLDKGFFTIVEDELEAMYAEEEDDEEVPF